MENSKTGKPTGTNVTNAMLYRLIDEISLNTIAIANMTSSIEEVLSEIKQHRDDNLSDAHRQLVYGTKL
jgi:hypothetical protein